MCFINAADPLLVPSGALDSLCHFMSCIVFCGMTADCFIATSCSCSCLLRRPEVYFQVSVAAYVVYQCYILVE